GLIDSDALIEGLKSGKIGGAALDVYEEESDLFFEDMSDETDRDEKMAMLLSMPNVLITSHQAFLTNEALENIALVTLENIIKFFEENTLENEICYRCPNN
ncbi:MAG: 2-hydroxyacid dehydrogenase, partial [Clostridia bacterium]|nr:2-hydroxyacid dehydrogenase [Clostridia bacterium]